MKKKEAGFKVFADLLEDIYVDKDGKVKRKKEKLNG